MIWAAPKRCSRGDLREDALAEKGKNVHFEKLDILNNDKDGLSDEDDEALLAVTVQPADKHDVH